MYHVGLIGCGGISSVHAQILRNLDNTVLTACTDIIKERSERFDCSAYTDWQKMLDNEQLDAVHLCTPHYLHPVMAAEAARRGIAVFTEKPPAIDAAGWQQIKDAARLVPVGVCFQNRYHPHIRSCRQFIEDGTYGSLLGIRAFVTWHRTAGYYAAADWKGKWASEGGGTLINQAVHTLDLVIGFLGMPDQAEAALRNHHLRNTIEVEDTVEIYLRRGSTTALIYASTAYSQDAPVLIELHFERAVIRLEGDIMTIIWDGQKQEISCSSDPAIGRPYWGSGHKACISDFYHCLDTGMPYPNSPDSCEATMQTLLKLYADCRAHIHE